MAHPNLVLLALVPEALGQGAVVLQFDEGASEFLMVGGLDLAAQLRANCLLAVTDAEHRHRQGEDFVRRARRVAAGDRGRPTGQDDRRGIESLDPRRVDIEGKDLAIDAAFAHTAGDQLRHL